MCIPKGKQDRKKIYQNIFKCIKNKKNGLKWFSLHGEIRIHSLLSSLCLFEFHILFSKK